MEKAYWLKRKRASLKMAKRASCSAARLAHYDLAGRYSVNALAAETQAADLAVSLPPAIYASGSNPSFDDADDA
jgi:hypothetical protein